MSNTRKLSAIALVLAGIPLASQAAFYNVTLLKDAANDTQTKASTISPDGTQVAVTEVHGALGLDREYEMPFLVDAEHFVNSHEDLNFLCENFYGYNTCNAWADERWFGRKASGEICTGSDPEQLCRGGYRKEISAWQIGYTSLQTSFLNVNTPINPFANGVAGTPPLGFPQADSTDVQISAISDNGNVVGNSSSPYFKGTGLNARAFTQRGFFDDVELQPQALTPLIEAVGQTKANAVIDLAGTALVFGSASVANMAAPADGNVAPQDSFLPSLAACAADQFVGYQERACQYFSFANQASVWADPAAQPKAISIATFPNGAVANGNDTAQASVQAAAKVNNARLPTLVGFSSFNENGEQLFARAVKFTPKEGLDEAACLDKLDNCWTQTLLPGLDIRSSDGAVIYRYTVANDINENGIVIGGLKYSRLNAGSYTERVFVYDNNSNQTRELGSADSSLFFDGANMQARSINNNNELVGLVDVENTRDRRRRQRGFIFLHGDAPNLASFSNQRGWLLDDLTNDGNASSESNRYRIADASAISEDGTIVGSAFYCEQGYSSVAHNAPCAGTERLVAVQLKRDLQGTITPRSDQAEAPIERSGSSSGLFELAFLGLSAGFAAMLRRKKS
ncbi:MAG: DUF3466 family protein [Vibrionaceae bacterium]